MATGSLQDYRRYCRWHSEVSLWQSANATRPCFLPRRLLPIFVHRPSRGYLSRRDYLIIFNCQSSVFTAVLAWRTIIACSPPRPVPRSRGNFSKSMPASGPRRFRFFFLSSLFSSKLVHLCDPEIKGNKGKTHCAVKADEGLDTSGWKYRRYCPPPGGVGKKNGGKGYRVSRH